MIVALDFDVSSAWRVVQQMSAAALVLHNTSGSHFQRRTFFNFLLSQSQSSMNAKKILHLLEHGVYISLWIFSSSVYCRKALEKLSCSFLPDTFSTNMPRSGILHRFKETFYDSWLPRYGLQSRCNIVITTAADSSIVWCFIHWHWYMYVFGYCTMLAWLKRN